MTLPRVITNIGELVTNDPQADDLLGIVTDAAVVIEGDRVAWVGPATDAPAADVHVDAGGRAVIPGFVDSHSHLVFAGDRAPEFAARMAGTPYAAGGIRTTVAATRAATDEQLTGRVAALVAEMRRQGTTTVEIKSGYGLTVRDEARSLAIARQFTDETTFLGAHVVPEGSDPAEYVALVTGPMLDACAPHARWIDVFCERGAFDADQARADPRGRAGAGPSRPAPRQPARRTARASGWPPSSAWSPSTTAPTSMTPTSTALADSGTVATLLPGVEFSTRQPYPDARRLARRRRRASRSPATATRAPATPPRCRLCVALAVREMGMTPAEATYAATAGGAAALDRDRRRSPRARRPGRPGAAGRPQPRAPRLPPRRAPRGRHLGRRSSLRPVKPQVSRPEVALGPFAHR